MKRSIYLDFAAATPLDISVLKEMTPYFSTNFYNPSADYLNARKIKSELNKARSLVANHLGTKPGGIIFTAGGTEANNLAIKGVMNKFETSKVLVSAIEHDSVLAPAANYRFENIKVSSEGIVDLELLKQQIDDNTVLVSVMYANNEIGTIQPIKQISRLLTEVKSERKKRSINKPLYLHCDACQAGNYLDLHVSRLGVDLMTLNGGKIYGPKQSGALYVRSLSLLTPIIEGGGQEYNLRSGTENVAQSIGFAKALDIAQNKRELENRRLKSLQNYFIYELNQLFPSCVVNGSLNHRLVNNVHVTFIGQDNERLIIALDQAGIMTAAGSACSASKEESSHVLKALGLTDKDARASLRISFGRNTTKDELTITLKTLSGLIN